MQTTHHRPSTAAKSAGRIVRDAATLETFLKANTAWKNIKGSATIAAALNAAKALAALPPSK